MIRALEAVALLRFIVRSARPFRGETEWGFALLLLADTLRPGALCDAESGIRSGEDETPGEDKRREDQKRGTESGNVAEHGWQDSGYSEQRRNPQRIRPGVSDTESELRQT